MLSLLLPIEIILRRKGAGLAFLISALVTLTSCSKGLGNKEIAEQGSYGIELGINHGCNQFAEPGQKFTYPVVIRAQDPLGGGIPGVPISFSTDGTAGVSILNPDGTTDSTGAVATNVIAPQELGKNFTIYAKLTNGKLQIGCPLGTFPEQLLVISDGPTYNFETEAVGATRSFTFVLDNTANRKATGIFGQVKDLPFAFKGGTFPGTGGTCGTELDAGQSCTFVVDFSPTAVGFSASQVHVNYKDGTIDRIAIRSIQGTGANLGKLVISDDPEYDYGSVVMGGSADHAFTVENIGTLPASSVSSTGLVTTFQFKGGSFPGAGGTCTATINPGTTCTIVVSFMPLSLGLHLDKIDLVYDLRPNLVPVRMFA